MPRVYRGRGSAIADRLFQASAAGLPQPKPERQARGIDDHLEVAVAVLGGLAIILAADGLIRREAFRPAVAAVALGGGAILFQLFTWAVPAFVGAQIIMALLHSFSDVFCRLFGGLGHGRPYGRANDRFADKAA